MSGPFIVAEMSANHLGSLARTHHIIGAAADAGADAIKFQTWSTGRMCVDRSYRLDDGPWAGRTLFELYEQAHLPWESHKPLFDHARSRGLIPFSAAFDRESVDFLETLGVDRHKITSFELVDLPLIRYMASKGKPMILSTGMATDQEVLDAMNAAAQGNPYAYNAERMTLLKCTSAYPAEASEANLEGMRLYLSGGFSAGLSDHTLGIGVAVAAAALGATYIEKHLTLSRADGGPDAGFSMEPAEFKQLVVECRRAAAAIGEVKYGPGPNESTALRRSLWVVRDIAQGELLTLEHNVRTARPALGLSPSFNLACRKARVPIKAGTPLTMELLE